MTPAPLIVAPHPDDEVLGCSSVLRRAAAAVVHVTDGVPPWTAPGERARLAQERRGEAADAWRSLSAQVDFRSLGFGDLEAWRAVQELAERLAETIAALAPSSVYLPAYQRGHPDHDASYISGALARRLLGDSGPQRWFVYGLYGFDEARRLRFGWLPNRRYGRVETAGETEEALESKAAALRCHASQVWPASVVERWLRDPAPEQFAPLPADWTTRPDVPCFYDEELGFDRHGASVDTVESAFASALALSAG